MKKSNNNNSSPTSSPMSNSRSSTSPISPRQLESTNDVSLSSPLSITTDNNNNHTTTNLVDTHAFRPSIPPKQFVEGETATSIYRQQQQHHHQHLLPLTTTGAGSSSTSCTGIPRHPRRMWAISDTQLRPRPLTYPPIPLANNVTATTSTVVSQATATPSVVAVRIAEALKRWPTAVEYDEDQCVAVATTSDRCSLTISLWRLPTVTATTAASSSSSSSTTTSTTADVLVECIRVRGSSITFGHLCQAILNAAQSMDSGDDTRRAYQMNVLEMGERWEQKEALMMATTSPADASLIARALEQIASLLRKDRLEAQQLGLERLVGLVDVTTSGVATAVVVARTIVMNPSNFGYLWSLIVDKLLHIVEPSDGSTATSAASTTTKSSSSKEDEDGLLRSMALRVLANALTILELHDQKSTLDSYSLSTAIPELIPVLLEDITSGPSRPPSVTRLASPHEACYAIRCLKILGVDQQDDKEQALEALERARVIGQATNVILEREARECYLKLTEQDRSC